MRVHASVSKWKSRALLILLLVSVTPLAGCFGPNSCDKYDTKDPVVRAKVADAIENGTPVPIEGWDTNPISGDATSATTAPAPDTAVEKPVLGIGNPMAVQNGGVSPEWEVKSPMLVIQIETYHWNDAQGATPGTISLESADGKTYGPWGTKGLPGQNDVPNATWMATPNEVIDPGTYKVIDSDPQTWSQNSGSNGLGFTNVYAKPAH